MSMYYYTVCYFTCSFYEVVRQISMLFIDNKDSVFCILSKECTQGEGGERVVLPLSGRLLANT